MLFTVIEDLTQAFCRKVISDTHKSLLCCGWCGSQMEIVFKSQSEKGSPLSLVKITGPKLISLWTKEPWPRVTEKNTGEKTWLQYLLWEWGPSWGPFFHGNIALPEPEQHAPRALPQQCEHLAQSSASAAGQSWLSIDSQLEHNDRRELKSVIRKLKTGWKLEISCTYPGGCVRDLIGMHTKRPALLSPLLYPGLKWRGAFQCPYWICLWRFKAFKSKISLIWRVRRGRGRHYRFNFQFWVTS